MADEQGEALRRATRALEKLGSTFEGFARDTHSAWHWTHAAPVRGCPKCAEDATRAIRRARC